MAKKNKDYEALLKNFDPASTINETKENYSDEKFWDKLKKYGATAGKKTIYFSLLLFYAGKSPKVPKSAKLTIVGALSYLILPIDLIPDFIPVVGLADDASVIAFAVYKVISHIDDDIKMKARTQLTRIIGEDAKTEEIDELLNKGK